MQELQFLQEQVFPVNSPAGARLEASVLTRAPPRRVWDKRGGASVVLQGGEDRYGTEEVLMR